MPIIVSCHCGRKFQVKEEYAGKQAKCPVCKKVLLIPSAEMEVGEEETMRGDDADEQQQEEQQEEEQLSPKQEARRQRQIKGEKDAKIRRRNNIIAFGSLGVMVLLAVGWSLMGRGSNSDALPPSDLKPTITDPVAQPGQQPKPASDSYASIPPPPTGQMDEVERYIQWAILAKDSAVKANALIFKPDDPRLNFETNWRQPRMSVKARLGTVLATFLDLESGPPPSATTDQTEARMLMDPDLVGGSVCTTAPGKTGLLYVFVDPVKMKMPDVIKKYGQPSTVPVVSGSAKINFYGRVSLVETEGGAIHCVARRQPKD